MLFISIFPSMDTRKIFHRSVEEYFSPIRAYLAFWGSTLNSGANPKYMYIKCFIQLAIGARVSMSTLLMIKLLHSIPINVLTKIFVLSLAPFSGIASPSHQIAARLLTRSHHNSCIKLHDLRHMGSDWSNAERSLWLRASEFEEVGRGQCPP